MAIKSVLTALINGNWGDITSPKRLPLKDRQVGSGILDEIYATPFSDTHLTTNVFTKANESFSYIIQGVKTGRNVVVSGSFKNITGDAIADIDLVNITNSEFNHFVFSPTKKVIAKNLTGQLVLMELASNKIKLQGVIPNTGLFYFEFTYQVAN